MQAQCWICPYCFDDHGRDKECSQADLHCRITILAEHLKLAKTGLDMITNYYCACAGNSDIMPPNEIAKATLKEIGEYK